MYVIVDVDGRSIKALGRCHGSPTFGAAYLWLNSFWALIGCMSDGLAKVLEGRNILTHNGTIQAI